MTAGQPAGERPIASVSQPMPLHAALQRQQHPPAAVRKSAAHPLGRANSFRPSPDATWAPCDGRPSLPNRHPGLRLGLADRHMLHESLVGSLLRAEEDWLPLQSSGRAGGSLASLIRSDPCCLSTPTARLSCGCATRGHEGPH